MMDLLTYAILKKKLSSSSTGVSDIQYRDGALVFILGDGSEVSIDLPQDEFRITPEGDLEIVTADGNTILYSSNAAYDLICGGNAGGKINE